MNSLQPRIPARIWAMLFFALVWLGVVLVVRHLRPVGVGDEEAQPGPGPARLDAQPARNSVEQAAATPMVLRIRWLLT